MHKNATFSIIVVNYNGGTLLTECIESVYLNTRDFELIVVDNASKDGSEKKALERFPSTVLIKNPSNFGFARANNIGIRAARGDWIVLLNPDTVVTPSWLESLRSCAEKQPRTGLVQPKLLRPDHVTIDSTGHVLVFRTGYTWDRGSGELDRGQFDISEEVPSCCFGAAMINRDVFSDIGLLDEKMTLYFEDVDFSLRARIAGWRVMYCPQSVVYHYRGGVTPKLSPMQRKAMAYRLRFMLKCYDVRNALRYGSERVIRDIVAMVAGVKNGDLRYFVGYFNSITFNIVNFPMSERLETQAKRRMPDSKIIQLADSTLRRARHPSHSG